MTFNLFLAAIPMLALAGWLFATVLHNSPDAMSSVSAWLDLSPGEVRDLVEQRFPPFLCRGGGAVRHPRIAVAGFQRLPYLHVGVRGCCARRAPAVVDETADRRRLRGGRDLAFGLSGLLAVEIAGGPIRMLSWFGAEAAGCAHRCDARGDGHRDLAARRVFSRRRPALIGEAPGVAGSGRHGRDRHPGVVGVRAVRQDAGAVRALLRQPGRRRDAARLAVAALRGAARRRRAQRAARRQRGNRALESQTAESSQGLAGVSGPVRPRVHHPTHTPQSGGNPVTRWHLPEPHGDADGARSSNTTSGTCRSPTEHRWPAAQGHASP